MLLVWNVKKKGYLDEYGKWTGLQDNAKKMSDIKAGGIAASFRAKGETVVTRRI